jgi:hypothetical protein
MVATECSGASVNAIDHREAVNDEKSTFIQFLAARDRCRVTILTDSARFNWSDDGQWATYDVHILMVEMLTPVAIRDVLE